MIIIRGFSQSNIIIMFCVRKKKSQLYAHKTYVFIKLFKIIKK